MRLETLELFALVVETGSFSRAAALHFVTQSSVSQQIRTLEELYGQRFLERSSRGVRLTPAGEVFYRRIRLVLNELTELRRELQDMAEAVSGEVRIATVYSVGLHMLPPYIKRYLETFPLARVHLEYERTTTVYEHVKQGLVEIGIVAGPRATRQIDVLPLMEEAMVLVLPPEHRLATAPALPPEALVGERFVAFADDVPTRQVMDQYFANAGVQVEVALALDNVETIKTSVEAGLGIAVLPVTCVAQEQRLGTLVVRRLDGPPLTRRIGAIYRRDHPFSQVLQRFLEMLGDPCVEGGVQV